MIKSSYLLGVSVSGLKTYLILPFHKWVKNITFLVSVPVLSEQIMLAPPIVSQACNYLTKFLSSIIFPTETARDRVTARGKPSGIATTKIVIAIIK